MPASIRSASARFTSFQKAWSWSPVGTPYSTRRPSPNAWTARSAAVVVFPPRRPALTTFRLAREVRIASCAFVGLFRVSTLHLPRNRELRRHRPRYAAQTQGTERPGQAVSERLPLQHERHEALVAFVHD